MIAEPARALYTAEKAQAGRKFHPRREHATPRCAEEPPPAPRGIQDKEQG